MKIEQLKISTLIPYASNARTHSEAQIAQIAGSIKEFGFTNPVLIDANDGIIAGHGRVLAAQSLSLEKVPCIRLGHLTEAQRRAYVIADNQIALNAGWNQELLSEEMKRLLEEPFDLKLLGFSDEELSALIGTQDDPEMKQLEIKAPPKMTWVLIGIPTSQFGDINEMVETIAKLESTVVETTANDG